MQFKGKNDDNWVFLLKLFILILILMIMCKLIQCF